MAELPDLAYNQSIPLNWYTITDSWIPSRFAYGVGAEGSGSYGTDPQGHDLDFYTVASNNVYCIVRYMRMCGWSFESIMAMVGNMQNESQLNPGYWEHSVGATDGGFGLVQWTPPNQYTSPALEIWGNTDPFYPYFYNGWYELYMIASEVFGFPRTQWKRHQAGNGHNPEDLSRLPESQQPDPPYYRGEYPGERFGIDPPLWDFRFSFEDFAKGVVYDSTAPKSTPYDRINYLTDAFYWNYEQVADFTVDNSLTIRRRRARNWYDLMLPFFTNFDATTIIRPDVPSSDFTIDNTPFYTLPMKPIYYLRPWWQRIGR